MKEGRTMLQSEPAVQVSDTTKADSSNAVKYSIFQFCEG